MEKTGQVSLQVDHDIGIVKIDNPPGNFLIRPEFIRVDDLREWVGINKLKGILVCGSGKHFSGGADLDALFTLSSSSENLALEIDKGKTLLRFIEDLNIPVIAAIKGICFGGGLEIALACHIRICSEKALFAFPEANRQLMPGLGGTGRVREQASLCETMKFILSGDMINAEEARTMKLVDHIVPDRELISHATAFMRKMTEGRDLKVINYVMMAFHNARKLSFEEAVREETRMFCELAAGERARRMGDEQ